MLEVDPVFANWDQDATAIEQHYGESDPAEVAAELERAAAALADHLASCLPEAAERPGRRGDGASFTVATLARYLLHDPVHHLHDVAPAP